MQRATFKSSRASYRLEDEDIDVLARALWGECGEAPSYKHCGAVAWTMLRRWMLWPRGVGLQQWPTFRAFIRAFSQPVNPKWSSADTDACKRNPDVCTPAKLERRRRIQRADYNAIPEIPRLAAEAFAIGLLDDPIADTVDFSATSLVRKRGWPFTELDGNAFVRRADHPMQFLAENILVSYDGAPGGAEDSDDDDDDDGTLELDKSKGVDADYPRKPLVQLTKLEEAAIVAAVLIVVVGIGWAAYQVVSS